MGSAILIVERYSPGRTRSAQRYFCIQLILRGLRVLRVLRGKSLLKYQHFIGTVRIAGFNVD